MEKARQVRVGLALWRFRTIMLYYIDKFNQTSLKSVQCVFKYIKYKILKKVYLKTIPLLSTTVYSSSGLKINSLFSP